MSASLLQRFRRWDDARAGVPGEHWLTLAAGIGMWLATRRHPSTAVRLIASVLGTAAAARALAGRKVPGPLRRVPFAQRSR